MFRGNLPYRLLGQNFYPLHRFRLSKSRHRFPRNILTLISHKTTTGSPVLLSDIVTDVATNRIYTGFSPHLHCRTQKRPCQFGRNSEPTKSFSYTYLLRVLPQISFSSQAKGFAPNEDKSFAPGINPLFKLAKSGLILIISVQLSIPFCIDDSYFFHTLFFVSHIFSTNSVPLHFFIIVCSSGGLQVCLLFTK